MQRSLVGSEMCIRDRYIILLSFNSALFLASKILDSSSLNLFPRVITAPKEAILINESFTRIRLGLSAVFLYTFSNTR